ncbi:MAG: hypothetical protein Q4C36_06650 [Coriobacteriia bacterium]|nr:hypothetical protein [Coriobacteriia bacterium]
MRITKFALVALAAALAFALAACSGPSSYSQELLEEADGIKVIAENAGSDQTALTEGAITVKEGDVIVISPCMEKGSFHLTITSQDGKTVAYDDDASGRVYFTIDAEPGVYDVKTSGNDATGWMTVFSSNAEEEAAMNASLEEVLDANGIDKEGITNR